VRDCSRNGFDIFCSQHAGYFVVVTLVTCFLLARSYNARVTSERRSLLKSRQQHISTRPRPQGKKDKQPKSEDSQFNVLRGCFLESAAYALFVNNLAYFALFLLFSFVLVPELLGDTSVMNDEVLVRSSLVSYVISVVAPGFIVSVW